MNTKVSISSIMKIINILFLIVLENFVLDCGMGFFGVSFLLLAVVYQLFFGGLQSGISKIVSIRNNKGLNSSGRLILKPAIAYVLIVSAVVFAFWGFFANSICLRLWGTSFLAPGIHVLCAAFLLNGLIDVICGYQNGIGNAVVLNLANLFRMLMPISFSFFLIPAFERYGDKVAALMKNTVVVSAYYSLAVACIYVLSAVLILLLVILLAVRLRIPRINDKNTRGNENGRSMFTTIAASSLKISLNQLFPLLSITVVAVVYLHMAYKLGIKPENAFVNMGSLFAKVLLPIALVYTVFSEYLTREKYRLHTDFRKDDYKTALIRAQYMIKNSIFMLLPPAVIFTFLADPFVKVFFTGQYIVSAKLLQTGGFLILIAGVVYALQSILKASGMELQVLGIQFLSFIIQLIVLALLMPGAEGNSIVVLYSFYVYYGIQLVVLFAMSYRFVRYDLMDILMKLGKYGAAAIVMMILFIILDKFVMMNVLLILLSMFLGYLLYYLTVLLLKGISKKDEQSLKRTLNYYPVTFLKSRLRL